MSFRLRLTLAAASAVALAVAVACAIAYVVVGQQLYGQVDSALRDEAASAIRSLTPPYSRVPSPELFSSSANDYMQVVASDGTIPSQSQFIRGQLPVRRRRRSRRRSRRNRSRSRR